jgi:hypothetical protein
MLSALNAHIIRVKAGRQEVRRNFFSGRVINAWNQSPLEMSNNRTTAQFKVAFKKTRVTREPNDG